MKYDVACVCVCVCVCAEEKVEKVLDGRFDYD